MAYPLVSIITPTFNRAYLIIETLDSIVKQTYSNWEAIIVDDGSTDGTADLLMKYTIADSRFKYFQRPDSLTKGANSCRNYGFSKSAGDLLVFLDSDDILSENCLHNRVALLENTQYDFLVFSMGLIKNGQCEKYIYPDLTNKTRAEIIALFLTGPLPWNITRPIWKRDIFVKHNGFNEKMRLLDDDEFNLRVMADPGIRFKFIYQTDCYYRMYEENKIKFFEKSFTENLVDSHLILLQTLDKIFNSQDKIKFGKSLNRNIVNMMCDCLGTDISIRRSFLKNVLFYFRHFRTSLKFKILVLGGLFAQVYPKNKKGSHSINKFFRNQLYKLS